ncbi:MAG: hypothetical protein A3F11_07110 [Gammaproteobacteria bacterium RIFCSPHIGHO2_12_FULL_37_14]|nr:MAG: hypothetical protein A3F11_07110 [Gammaproteobacteria bacterium RIFCSPHIGHO2_12_FULL_37_14]
MSAYILDKKSFDALVYAATDGYCDRYTPKRKFVFAHRNIRVELTENELGQLLVDQNYESFNYRYSKSQKPYLYKYEYDSVFETFKPVDFFKLCDCYEYQSCETNEYANSVADRAIFSLRKQLIRALPGYEDAAWGLC